jgi:hypothetical protein
LISLRLTLKRFSHTESVQVIQPVVMQVDP